MKVVKKLFNKGEINLKNVILIGGIFLLLLSVGILASARDFNIFNAANTAQTYLFVDGTSGYVGIGTTSPHSELDLGSSISSQKLAIYNNAGGTDFYGLGVTSSTLHFQTQSTDKMVIQGSNVGIGIPSPTKKLDVAGSIKLTGSLVYSSIPRTGSTTMGNPTYNTLSEVAFVNTAYNTNSCYWKSGTSTCLVTLYSYPSANCGTTYNAPQIISSETETIGTIDACTGIVLQLLLGTPQHILIVMGGLYPKDFKVI